MYPALCFLTLRGALEFKGSMSSEEFPYEFESGLVVGMPYMEFTHRDSRGPRNF